MDGFSNGLLSEIYQGKAKHKKTRREPPGLKIRFREGIATTP